eukprot:5114816-Prymnesium_polylepis.2
MKPEIPFGLVNTHAPCAHGHTSCAPQQSIRIICRSSESTNLLYNWFASLRADIAHACELRRSEYARVVCSAARSAVFNRVPYYSATKTTLFR